MSLISDVNTSKTGFYESATQKITTQIQSMKEGPISLFVSGGSTPGPIYQRLSALDLQWSKVRVGLVDERWVDESNAGSNAALIRKTLLQKEAQKASFFPMKNDKTSAQLGLEQTVQTYHNLLGLPSVAILGMGTDGHFAGCFPGAKGSIDALNKNSKAEVKVIHAQPSKVTGPYLERITLTLPALMRCEKIFLLITGEAKKDIIDKAITDPNCDLPIVKLLDAAALSHKPNLLEILYTP